MFRTGLLLLAGVLVSANGLRAFDLKQLDSEVFDRLAKKAREAVNISLDGGMLKAAKNFLPSDEPDSAKMRNLIEGLKSVSVRSFEFNGPGGYSAADLDLIRKAILSPEWKRIVDVKEEGESTQVYMMSGPDKPQGVVIVAAEEEELTVVHIEGPINLEDLSSLRGIGVDLKDIPKLRTR